MSHVMAYRKETKNTVVYESFNPAAPVTAVYINKPWLRTKYPGKFPAAITLSIEKAPEDADPLRPSGK
jgi:hypothetical protein